MLTLVKFIGIFMVGIGMIFLLNPKIMNQYIAFWMTGKRIYCGGILNLLFAIVFLLSASQAKFSGVVIVIGVISLAKGIMILSGPEKMKGQLEWWAKRTPMAVRFLSFISISIGLLLLYSL